MAEEGVFESVEDVNPKSEPAPKTLWGWQLTEPLDWDFCRAVLGEFFALMMFLWYTTSTVVYFRVPFFQTGAEFGAVNGAPFVFSEGDSATQLMIATSFGIAIVVLVYAFAQISGGHVNPAVTLGLFLSKRISLMRMVCYIPAQMVGAIVGSALVRGMGHDIFVAANGGANKVFTEKDSEAVLGEILGTAGLVFTVLRACDKQNAGNWFSACAIGFSVWIAHLSLIPIDGTSINPARSFGPAVVADAWEDQWVFWVGPFAGAAFAALVYELLFRSKE